MDTIEDIENQGNLVLKTRKKKCGCSFTRIYNDDPKYTGYDSDRESTETKLCLEHRKVANELKENLSSLYSERVKINLKIEQIETKFFKLRTGQDFPKEVSLAESCASFLQRVNKKQT